MSWTLRARAQDGKLQAGSLGVFRETRDGERQFDFLVGTDDRRAAEAAVLEGRQIVIAKLGETSEVAIQMTKDAIRMYELWEKADPGRGHGTKAAELKAKSQAPGGAEKPGQR